MRKRKAKPVQHKAAKTRKPMSITTMGKKGESIYQELFGRTAQKVNAEFVAIHLASRRYVVGATKDDVIRRYQSEFGTAPGYLRKVSGFEHAGSYRI